MAQTESDYNPGGRPFTGRKVLLVIVSFFGVIIAVNMTMLYMALDAWPGLVVKNSYIASQTFEETRAAVAARDARGWVVGPEGWQQDDKGIWRGDLPPEGLRIGIATPEGPLAGLAVTAQMYRPTSVEGERSMLLEEVAPGQYLIPGPIQQGAWDIRLIAEGSGEPYKRSLSLWVKAL